MAPTNAVSTGEPLTGVSRGVQTVPAAYTLKTGAPVGDPPDFIDPAAEQYRAAILDAPSTGTVEYLLWAQNGSQLSLVDDPDWWFEQGAGGIPQGTNLVIDLTPATNAVLIQDGTDHVVVKDSGNRPLGQVLALVVARGDVDDYDDTGWVDEDNIALGREGDNPYIVLTVLQADQDPVAGIVTFTAAQLTTLGGGLSALRGDRVVSVRYTLAPAKFWWTRNDPYETRFGWKGQSQRWEPYRGSATINVGRLLFDTVYQLDPAPKNLTLGSILLGSPASPDTYSTVRLGTAPSATSTPVGPTGTWKGIQVRGDSEFESGFDFGKDPNLSGAVSQTTGILEFNPEFIKLQAGKTIWFSPQGFSSEADGVVGALKGADINPLYIAPIPGPWDYPFIRLGSRHYLTPIVTTTDAALATTPVVSGQVGISMSTGKLKFSTADTDKADPTKGTFSKHYLGAQVYYDGCALNGIPQPTKAPRAAVNSSGVVTTVTSSNDLFIPDAQYLPTEFISSDAYRGLGQSGIMDVSDATGAIPAQVGFPATVRPGGDTTGSTTTGRVRQVNDGVGDTIVFSHKGALHTIIVEDWEDDMPSFLFSVPQGTAYIVKDRSTHGSQILIGREDRERFAGKSLYFLQASLTPAYYTTTARLYSRVAGPFTLRGTENFYFAVDGTGYVWNASALGAGSFTADQVAASINLVVAGVATTWKNYLVLSGSLSVEIGFGDSQALDRTGSAALGFRPGWRVAEGVANWLPDSGVSFGLQRSPLNRDRSGYTSDFKALDRLEGLTLQDSVSEAPFVFLDHPPLQDVAGIDEGIFFSLLSVVTQGSTVQVFTKQLEHYEDVDHKFGELKFHWIENNTNAGRTEQPTQALSLGDSQVVPESLLAAPGVGGGLYIAEDGGAHTLQVQDTDYILDETPGTAVLIYKYGNRIARGGLGTYTQGSTAFADSDATFLTATIPVQAGNKLKLTSGDDLGFYEIQSVPTGTSLVVSPPLRNAPTRPVPWEIYAGFNRDVYDPSVVADQVYKTFNHLETEPFQIRVLTPLGTVPTVSGGTRLKANLEAALTSGRAIEIRYGLVRATATNTATLVQLGTTKLGTMANNKLNVQGTGTARFTAGAFSIKVGAQKFTSALGTLVPVASFSVDPGSTIEYLTAASGSDPVGRLKFGTQVLSSYRSSTVWYMEEFQAAAALAALTVEYDSLSGEMNFSTTDMASYGGTTKAYLVERMITEERQDVGLSPLEGSFAFHRPIQEAQTVEAQYWRADLEGRKTGTEITEFLPIFIRNEEATRSQNNIFLFNGALRTVDTRVTPVVYVGPTQQNFGADDYLVDYPASLNGQGRLTFTRDLPTHVTVKVNYAVFEALGGEHAYESSSKPIYRPPFFIQANKSRFGVHGNRTTEFQPGQMLRIGSECFYVRGTTYYPQRFDTGVNREVGNVTSVDIFPGTTGEAGIRAPGNDILTVITEDPITTVVDPDGTPVATTADAGFMQAIPVGTFPFEPVSKGQATIVFHGDLTQFASAGHIFEIGGKPYTVASSTLSDDGKYTRLSVTSPFQDNINLGDNPTVKLSYRPVYPPRARHFLGIGPILDAQGHTLVLYGETDSQGVKPGRLLQEGVDYHLDRESGSIELMEPHQEPLGGSQRLVLSFTKPRVLGPFWKDGTVVVPRYYADYLHITIPNATNGFLGGRLSATYTFRSPDTFYVRMVSLEAFLGEAAQEAIAEISSKEAVGGPSKVSRGGGNNWDQGVAGLWSERQHLLDKDRAARTFLEFYNTATVSFEQVMEAIQGGVIGDRDGKFRFWVGKGSTFAGPGYEDDVSGVLVMRNLWTRIFLMFASSGNIHFRTSDYVVDPDSATLAAGVLEGDFIDPDWLDLMIRLQRTLIKNDVDDVVMTGLGRLEVYFTLLFPFFHVRAKGVFARMADPHPLSRIFPGRTRAFFYTYPGIDADVASGDTGFYSFGKMFKGRDSSTFLKTVAQLSNPVLNDIRNVGDATLNKRRARARIWGVFPKGIPAFAFGSAITDPCIIAFPSELRDIPIDPSTGYPDRSQLLSQGGVLPDALAGNPSMVIPGFTAGDQISWGKPDGTLYKGYSLNPLSIFGLSGYEGLFVDDVQYGCVITFEGSIGTTLTDSGKILVGTGQTGGIPFYQALERGDTIFIGPPVGLATTPTDPPKIETIQSAARALGVYRTGFDLVVKGDGRVLDMSFPSFSDPWFLGIQEILGQNPLDPMSPMEGPVEFYYDKMNPLKIPALLGDEQDDSGDNQIPYLKTGTTELDRFGEIGAFASDVIVAEDSTNTWAIYPDEIVGHDGEIVGATAPGFGAAAKEPAMLMTFEDALPVTHGVTDPGIADVQPFDFLLVEADDNEDQVPMEAQGILSVGRVTPAATGGGNWGSYIEPPRFVTATTPPTAPPASSTGSPVRYEFSNAITYTNTVYPPDPQVAPTNGCKIKEDMFSGQTILDMASIGALALNDGLVAGSGNLNTINAASANNLITITLYRITDPNSINGPAPLPADGAWILKIYIKGNTIAVQDYRGLPFVFGAMGGAPTFGTSFPFVAITILDNREILLPITGVIPFVSPNENQWYIPHTVVNPGAPNQVKETIYGFDFTVDVDTYNFGGGVKGQSNSAYIGTDRLTFNDVFDLRRAKMRGTTHPLNAGTNMEARLVVHEVTVADGAAGTASTVNRDVNGVAMGPVPIPFTFMPKSTDAADSAGGVWTAKTGLVPENGNISVMAYEGYNNTPIVNLDPVHFSAIPSSRYVKDSTQILLGHGKAASKSNTVITPAVMQGYYDDRIAEITVTSGAVDNVEPGDVLVIHAAFDLVNLATTKAGTYLVKHVVSPTVANYKTVQASSVLGGGAGWVRTASASVVSLDATGVTLTTDGTAGLSAAGGTVYVFLDTSKLTSTVQAVYKLACISMTYTGYAIVIPSGEVTFSGLAAPLYADGTAVPSLATAATLIQRGMQIGGVTDLDIDMGGVGGLPDTNVVGHNDPTVNAIRGFRYLTVTSPSGTAVTYDGATPDFQATATPAVGKVGVTTATPIANTTFNANVNSVVYPGVPDGLVFNLNAAAWLSLNTAAAYVGPSSVRCFVPGTVFALENGAGALPGFFAQSGVFLEPSVPRPVFNLSSGGTGPHLVDQTFSQLTTDIGFRDFDALRGTLTAPITQPEDVVFEVRRIRRFHDVINDLGDHFLALRFAYETRRGRITGYTQDNKQFGHLHATNFTMNWETTKPGGAPQAPDVWNDSASYSGTNLGRFNNADVNIHAGDMFRVLDSNGDLYEEVEVAGVEDGDTLMLAPPGLVKLAPAGYVGMRFEVYIHQSPVPHEQSNEQLLDLITDQEVCRTFADHTTEKGGYVPQITTTYAAAANNLYDDLNADGTGSKTFTALGVKKKDIVIVDPTGTIPKIGGVPTVAERGSMPVGDEGVVPRGVDYTAGSPSKLDDNRGFFRVLDVDDSGTPFLKVSGVSTFAGSVVAPEIYPEVVAQQATRGYAVYPTVNGSNLNAPPYAAAGTGEEGQMDLRPTRKRDAVTKSYQSYGDGLDEYAIRPFSYRVIRPSRLFSDEAVDLVLTIRERMLSLIELFRVMLYGYKKGTYWVFQRDEHCGDIESPTDPTSGLGVPSNNLIQLLIGRVGVVPFISNSVCLSILDRRFWIRDYRLDSLTTLNNFSMKLQSGVEVPYTAYTDTSGGASVRPVLPDWVDTVLDMGDRFRSLRYVWLAYRTHRLLGTRAAISRFDAEFPKRLAEQNNLLLLTETTEKIDV